MADFPSELPSITNPTANDTLAAVPHDEQHAHANDNLTAIATKLGTGSSTPAAGTVLTGTGSGTSKWVAGWFNVKAYGALGDNSTDDTAAIQAAIDDCEAAGGGMVWFPRGIYQVTGLTVDSDNVHLVGAGWYASMIKGRSSMTGHMVTITADYCSVRDLMLYGATVGQDCLRLYGAARFHGDNLYINEAGANGISILQVDGSNTAHANIFSNILIRDCAGYGVHQSTGSYDCEWVNLWIGQCNIGLYLSSGANTYSTLHVWGCTSDGVQVRSWANRFANVYLETNGGDGIDFSGARYNSVVGGVLRGNVTHGAQTGSASTYNRFVGLAVYNNGGTGIRLESGSDYSIIADSQFFDDQTPKTQDIGIVIIAGTVGAQVCNVVSLDADHETAGLAIADGTTDVLIANGDVIIRGTVVASGAAGTNRDLGLYTEAEPRWIIRANSTAEAGANAGSDLLIMARDDAGGALSTPVSISRASGQVTLSAILQVAAASGIRWGSSGGPLDLAGSGSPEGVYAAPVGSTYRRTDGGAGTTWYVKESSPTPSTGWVPK